MATANPIPNDPRFKNRTGERHGRLTVLFYAGRKRWLCRCDCGREAEVGGGNLGNGNTRSCGCLQAEVAARRNTTHGKTDSPEYRSWSSMIGRCFNSNSSNYGLYGARGITVCDRWRESFEAFLADMGPRPSGAHSIDRINNDGDYAPGNCRWATDAEQGRNKRNSHMIAFAGETLCIADWSDRTGVPQSTLWQRLRRGWSVDRALSTPVLKTWSRLKAAPGRSSAPARGTSGRPPG